MTDHDRARLFHAFACAMAGTTPQPRHARRWLAKAAGYSAPRSHRWGDDDWPAKARGILDAMGQVHPLQWPEGWRV